jgi:hypothetical protein
MGRTFLDIDMVRAADLLGMERRQAESIRDLARGQFLGLGPAISRRPVAVNIGSVLTGAKSITPGLMPLPTASTDELRELLHDNLHVEPERPDFARPAPRPAVDVDMLSESIAQGQSASAVPPPRPERPEPEPEESRAAMLEILNAMAQDPECTFQSSTTLFQDFTIRCRMKGISVRGVDATMFRRGFAAAMAGIEDPDEERWVDLVNLAKHVPDDALAPFYMIARAAMDGQPCPDDMTLARIYGTSSPRRVARLLDYLEKDGLIVVRTDFSGKRSVGLPDLGVTTAPVEG